jgi:hypothetical protein
MNSDNSEFNYDDCSNEIISDNSEFDFDDHSNDINSDNDEFNRDNYEYFSTLFGSSLEEKQPGLIETLVVDTEIDDRVRSSIDRNGLNITMPTIPSDFGDFIISYLLAPPLDDIAISSSSYQLSKNLVGYSPQLNSSALWTLFVGNIPHEVTWRQLKDYFKEKDYPAKEVRMKKKSVCANIQLFRSQNFHSY